MIIIIIIIIIIILITINKIVIWRHGDTKIISFM